MTERLAALDLVHDDLMRVEQKIRSIGSEAYAPLAEAFLNLLGSGGKRLRPALALLAYRTLTEPVAGKCCSRGGRRRDTPQRYARA